MRNNLHTFTPGDDIRYRGPLSYQWLQALGWFCIVVAAGRVLLKLGIKMDPVIAAEGPRFLAPMATIASLAVPFLMVAWRQAFFCSPTASSRAMWRRPWAFWSSSRSM